MLPVSAAMASTPSITTKNSRPWLEHYDPQVPSTLSYPRQPIYSILEDSAARYPEKPCVSFFGRCLTYRQVNDVSDRLAAGLRRIGMREGDRIALASVSFT